MPLKGKQNDLRTQEAVFSLNVPVTEVTQKSQETKSVSAKTIVNEMAFLLLFITCFVEFFDVFFSLRFSLKEGPNMKCCVKVQRSPAVLFLRSDISVSG